MCIQTKRTKKDTGCHCKHCMACDKHIWATITECKCGCHDNIRPTGHDGLCCAYPNGVRLQNPYKRLASAEHYTKILRKFNEE